MSDATATAGAISVARPQLDHKVPLAGAIVFIGLLLAGIVFMAYGLSTDFADTGAPPLAVGAFVLLGHCRC